MKRGALLLTLFVAAFGAGCSNSGSSNNPPPPVGGFSNSSLKGQYAFIMTGQAPDGFIARVGSFTADGINNITGGVELVSTASGGLQQFSFQQSAYQVNADGRGAMNLTNLTGTFSLSITMISATKGYLAQTDGVTTTSGTFELQDASAFTANALSGSFVFDNSGLDAAGSPDSIVGQIALNSGVVQGGVYDENAGALASGPVPITNGTLSISDATNGLGSLKFNSNSFQYAFVIVNSTKLHMIEVPASGSSLPVTAGTANGQAAPPANNPAFSGNFVFLIFGVGTHSSNVKAGRFTADGAGGLNLNSLALDDKQLGSSITQIPSGTLSNASYTIDTNFPASGRGTATFTDSSKGTFKFIFYMSSASEGVIQDNSLNLVGDGVIRAQTGAPFSNGSLANDYAFNWSGVSTNSTNGVSAEEDFVGHVKITSAASGNLTGTMDFSELNSNQGAFHNSALTGDLTIAGDGTNSSGQRSGVAITATNPNGGPSTTFNFTVYVVNPQMIFVVSQDSDRVTGGAFTAQVTPP